MLHNEIIDTITVQLDERFGNIKKLEFLRLLDPSQYKNYQKNFPDTALENLKQHCYGDLFNLVLLKNELCVLYTFEDMAGKKPYELVRYLKDENLDAALPEVYKLGVLILTIPSTTASVERSFSALKRIKTYQRSTQGQERLSSLSTLSIEQMLLCEIKSDATFYDDVINVFIRQERRMEFIYK